MLLGFLWIGDSNLELFHLVLLGLDILIKGFELFLIFLDSLDGLGIGSLGVLDNGGELRLLSNNLGNLLLSLIPLLDEFGLKFSLNNLGLVNLSLNEVLQLISLLGNELGLTGSLLGLSNGLLGS